MLRSSIDKDAPSIGNDNEKQIVGFAGTHGLGEAVSQLTVGTGVVASPLGLITVNAGTDAGSVASGVTSRAIQSRRGGHSELRIQARFPEPAAGRLALVGGGNATEGVFFGYLGLTFGIFRAVPGQVAIWSLDITSGTNAPGNVTVTLDGVAYVVAVPGAKTPEELAWFLSRTSYDLWLPSSNGSTLLFVQTTPIPTSGGFTLAGTGSAGTFSQVVEGVANDFVAGFTPRSSWSRSRALEWSPTDRFTRYVIRGHFEPGGVIDYFVERSGESVHVHRSIDPDGLTNLNPAYSIGAIASNLAEAPEGAVEVASATGIYYGEKSGPAARTADVIGVTATATQTVVMAIRVRREYAGAENLLGVVFTAINASNETANRTVRVQALVNPIVVGDLEFAYIDEPESVVEVAKPTSLVTVTGGREVPGALPGGGGSQFVDVDLRVGPGDMLVITVETSLSTATASVAVNWTEER